MIFSSADSPKFPVYIGKIYSKTNSVYNFDPYTFPLCKKSRIQNEQETKSFVEIFSGNSMSDIGLEIPKMSNVDNQSLCSRGMTKNNFIDMKTAISQNMFIQFLVNGSFATSVQIGMINRSNYFYFSHWSFKIYYHKGAIVFSSATSSDPVPLSFGSDLHFTYSISSIFINKNTFSEMNNEAEVERWYRFYSLLKIAVYIITVISVLGFLLIEKVTNDLNEFQKDSQFDDFDESGNQFHWRLLHGDIFRQPKKLNILSSMIGSSFHLIFSVFVLILINSFTNFIDNIGFFSLSIIVFVFSSFLSGFTSITISHQFGEKQNAKSLFGTSLVFPIPFLLIQFLITILTNFTLISLKNLILLILLVFFFIVPLSFLGGYFGNKNHLIECPCEVAAIPRKLPKLPFLLRDYILFPIVGSICSFFFIHEFEFMNEFIVRNNKKWFLICFSTVFVFSLLLVSTISIISVYILMKQQCYSWQWKSFLAPFCSSFFLFAYLLNFLNNHSVFCNKVVAFLVSLSCSYLFGLIFGGMGFASANIFIRIIYSNLKFS